jgi:putative toxin-antitoxin system antitoxin component (TIGR02293 family)
MPKPRVRARALRRPAAGAIRAIPPRPSPRAAGGPAGERALTFRGLVAGATPTARKIDAIRRGVRARVVDDMVAYLDVPKSAVFTLLHAPESTAHRLIRDDRPLDSAASERVVRIADAVRLTEATFGGRDAATRWLKTPNLALAGATPLSMLDTEPGAHEVRRILSSIGHGGAF